MIKKDYHKGVRLQVYIPDELDERLTKYTNMYATTKTSIVTDALYSYIGESARDSIEKAYSDTDKHTNMCLYKNKLQERR